ncbi:Replication protein O [Burkholderia sp. WTPI3]|uniref:Replication protein O n=1 Tax=Burkholderia sp. WTPI3 TaxID=2822167 RepID=UPI001F23215B|nr:Replication protein O [Burkholderia sp. WTPI3]
MSIAQPQVAGEGEAHPDATALSISAADSQARAEFSCDATNLPWTTFRAAFRASHMEGLSARARAVLAALARTVLSNRPYAAIFARRTLLTGRAMQSMRTFYRALDDLEAAGLIVRAPQQRIDAEGRFGRAYLHLTEKAVLLLGFVEPAVAVRPPVDEAPEHRADDQPKPSLGAQENGGASPPATVADGAIYREVYPTSLQKRQPGALPPDLIRLTSLGFNKNLVFKLMGEATRAGKRLSDVVESCWEPLRKAFAPIAYLRALLSKPVDFRYQARQRRDEVERSRVQEAEQTELTDALHRHAGQILLDPETRIRVTISDDALSATVVCPNESRPRSAAGTALLDLARGIVKGRLRPLGSAPVEKHAVPSRIANVDNAPETGEGGPASLTHVHRMREMLKRFPSAHSGALR